MDPNGVALGVFVWPRASGNAFSSINDFIGRLGRTPAIIQTFADWQTPTGVAMPFPQRFASFVAAKNATPMITWQPGRAGGGVKQPDFSWVQLASPRYDAYVRAWASSAKSFGMVVYVRLMHEMNIPVYPWSYHVNGNLDPRDYVLAWKHIVGIFREVGASNVQFVWCAAAGGVDASPAVNFLPGDDYISWVSLDGYNRLRAVPWRTFSDIFGEAYATLAHASHRPVMIAETGTVEDPSDPSAKATWIAQLQSAPTQFPRMKAILYFDAPGRGFSYPLTSSAAAFDAFRKIGALPVYGAAAPTATLSFP